MKILQNLFFIILFLFFISCDKKEIIDDKEYNLRTIDSIIGLASGNDLNKELRKSFLNDAYNVTRSINNKAVKLQAIRSVSSAYYELDDFERFKELNKSVMDLSKLTNDSLALAKSYTFYAFYFRKKSQLDSAYKYFYEAEKIYTDLDKRKTINRDRYLFDHGQVLIDLAKLSRKVKDYSESEDLTIQAIKKIELSGKVKYLPLAFNDLGIIAKHLERYEDAVSYYQKAIEYAKGTSKDTVYRVLGNNNIGNVYKSEGRYSNANEYYEKALSFKDYLKRNQKRYAMVLDNLAYSKFLSNPNDESLLKFFYKAKKIQDSLGDIVGLSTNSIHLAEYYQKKGNDSVSRFYATKAKDYAGQVNNNVELLHAYEILSDVSDSDKGLSYAKQYIKLNDSLLKQERLYKNTFARIRYETDETKKELSEISRQNEILVIAVLGLTALFLLIYIIFRQQQSNKELLFAQQQQSTNEEIYRLLLSQQVKLEEGRQLEQQRMSEELHDGVLGRLFGVRLSLDGINQRVNDGFTETRTKYIEELKSIEKEIRLISHDLGTETLSPEVAYIDSVESLISDLCEAHKMDFEFFNDENIDWEEIDDQKKVNLFRILQESMQNTFKHAKAKKIKISFQYVDDNINLLILDDGIGFKSNKVKRGIGLKNITSRVSQMSGVVDFISNKDAGTKVSVKIPA